MGSGRTEIARIAFGCDMPDSGEIIVKGKRAQLRSPADAVSLGMAFCTENRREEGIFPDMSVENNIVTCSLSSLTTLGFIDDTAEEVARGGGRAVAVRCDHRVDDEVRAVIDRIADEQGRLDIVVNNASGNAESDTRGKRFWEIPLRSWDDLVDVGLRPTSSPAPWPPPS